MESCSSLSDFSPLKNVFENPSVVGEVSEVMSVLRKDGENSSEGSDGAFRESRRNIHLANDKDEDEDGEDEVFNSEKENKIESQEKKNRKEKNNIRSRQKKYKVPVWSMRSWCGNSGDHMWCMLFLDTQW